MTDNQELIEGCARRARENRLGGFVADVGADTLQTVYDLSVAAAIAARAADDPAACWFWHELGVIARNEMTRRLLMAGGEIEQLERLFSIGETTE